MSTDKQRLLDLAELAPWVRDLVRLAPRYQPGLAGLLACAPEGLLDDARTEHGRGPMTPIPWAMYGIVRHALLPLARLTLAGGQPIGAELDATLVDVLADPRLGVEQREDLERVRRESKDLERRIRAFVRNAIITQLCDPSRRRRPVELVPDPEPESVDPRD